MDEYLVRPLRDFVQLFERLDIPYALMGGVAVGAHGIPRPTHDLDFTATIDRDQLPRLYAAAEKLGYTAAEAHAHGWVDQIAGMPLVRIRQWVLGEALDIDIFLAESRFQQSVLERRMRMEFDDTAAWVVTPEDLILLKLVAGRPRDLADILDILLAQGRLDDQYLQQWAEELGVAQRWKDALAQFGDGQ